MSNGIAFTPSQLLLACLAASAIAIGGCDSREAPPPVSHTPDLSVLDPSDNGRQRDDLARGRVWIANAQGVFLYNIRTGKLDALTLPSWQWVDTPYSCPPDIAIGPAGEAVVTSNIVPVLWRIDPRTLTVSVHELALDADINKDVGFTRLVYSPQQQAYLGESATHGSLWRIDPSLRKATKLGTYERARTPCGVSAFKQAE